LEKYGDGNVKIASTAGAIILGTHRSMMSSDRELDERIQAAYDGNMESFNPCTRSIFVPEFTASPHPRFLGLA
jgi:dissimilatory sulfite reductase (desulfoviridin) alpha/beta subunit